MSGVGPVPAPITVGKRPRGALLSEGDAGGATLMECENEDVVDSHNYTPGVEGGSGARK